MRSDNWKCNLSISLENAMQDYRFSNVMSDSVSVHKIKEVQVIYFSEI